MLGMPHSVAKMISGLLSSPCISNIVSKSSARLEASKHFLRLLIFGCLEANNDCDKKNNTIEITIAARMITNINPKQFL